MLSDKIHASNECRLIYRSLLYIIVGICMKTLFLGNESCFGCFDGLSYIIIITLTGTGLTDRQLACQADTDIRDRGSVLDEMQQWLILCTFLIRNTGG